MEMTHRHFHVFVFDYPFKTIFCRVRKLMKAIYATHSVGAGFYLNNFFYYFFKPRVFGATAFYNWSGLCFHFFLFLRAYEKELCFEVRIARDRVLCFCLCFHIYGLITPGCYTASKGRTILFYLHLILSKLEFYIVDLFVYDSYIFQINLFQKCWN